jgi:hypothetical protein
MIFAIGDSHVNVFSGNDAMIPLFPDLHNNDKSFFKTIRIGPSTAFNFHKKDAIINEALSMLNAESGDMVILCVGEIDCRYHIPKAIINKIDYDKSITNTVDNLFIEIDLLREKGFNTVTYSVPGSCWLEESEDVDFPRLGDQVFRNKISHRYNEYLEYRSGLSNIKNINIFNKLVNENFLTLKEYYLDDIHLRPTKVLPMITDKYFDKNNIK